MSELFPVYPRLFQESDIKCFHPIENIYAVSRRNPNSELCKNCRAGLVYQQKLYERLIHREPIVRIE